MQDLKRILEKDFLTPTQGKVTLLYGARRTGKTTLIQHSITQNTQKKIFTGTGDDIEIRNILASQNLSIINNSFKGYDIIFIDEAQRIDSVGWGLKLLVDSNPDIAVIASGSSSFDLANKTGEPLTGRQNTYTLFPVSAQELELNYGRMHIIQNLNNYLVYGMYPEILMLPNNTAKQKELIQLRNNYLFKDILEFEKIKNASKLFDLLKLIAFQIGHEVSNNELANSLGIAKQTVERYLDLLEKSFIIIKVRGFSRNLRKEVNKSSRYYFYDNGIRNSLIQNFNDITTRDDVGLLWENFCFMERLKKQAYNNIFCNNYFWRTYDKQEIDLLEEREGNLFGYEFKWNAKKIPKPPVAFVNAYPKALYECITPATFLDFAL